MVGGEVGRRQDRVDQAGRGQQRRVGELAGAPDRRPASVRSSHRYRRSNWSSSSGRSPVGRPARRCRSSRSARQAERDRLRRSGCGGSGCAPAPPSRPRGRRASRHSASIVRYSSSASSRRPRLYRRGVAAGAHLERAWRSSAGSTSRSAARSAARSPARSRRSALAWSAARRSSPTTPLAPSASSTASTTGRYCSAATANSSGTRGQPPRHRQLQGASPLRHPARPGPPRGSGRGGTAPPRAPRAPPPAGPRRGRAPAAARPRPPARRSRPAAGASSARPPRHAIASTSCRDARRHRRRRRAAEQPGDLGPAAGARARPPSSHCHPAAVGGQHAVAAQRVEQLHGLVRVAARVRLDQPSTRPAAVGRSACSMSATIVDEARPRQVVQPQVPHPGLVDASATAAPPADAPRPVVVAVRAHQQQARRPAPRSARRSTTAERRPPRPLQVVDEHHHRPLAARRPRAARPRPLRCARACAGQRIARIGRHRRAAPRTPAPPAVSRPALGPTARQDPLADLRPAQAPARPSSTPAQRAERLMDRVELQIAPVLVELAGHEPAVAARSRTGRSSIDQRRLADPRRAADQHAATPARQRLLERRLQRRHLRVAPHQPRRRQQPQRNVALADAQARRRACRRRAAARGRGPGRPRSGSGCPAPSPADA